MAIGQYVHYLKQLSFYSDSIYG